MTGDGTGLVVAVVDGLFLSVDGSGTAGFGHLGHLGSTATFTAALDFSATDGTGVVAMTNAMGGWEAVLSAVAASCPVA
jgi:hypothetical protein